MSTGYSQVLLSDMVEELGESATKDILSHFSCPMNPDVENFLKSSAIEFSKQGISATHLVFSSYKGSKVIVGYYTLANKYIHISGKSVSNSLRKRISKFGIYDQGIKGYVISAPLIAQFSKNYSDNIDSLISGDELMSLALVKVKQLQAIVGGKIVYLECEDKPKLIEFYKSHGFVEFGKRQLTGGERKLMGEYLVQMLHYRKGA